MRKNLFGSFSFASVLIATALVGFDTQIAMACSGGGSSSSGVSHGSSMGSGSVTVCVGSSGGSAGSRSTQTITKTVTVKVPAKPKTPPKSKPKVVSQPAPKPAAPPVQASCPSASAIASMPRSADAAERWVESICSPAPKTVSAPKPAPKPTPKVSAKPKYETRTITETITIDTPGSSYAINDAAQFYPNPLRAVMTPNQVLAIGAVATFSSNPTRHYGSSSVLGRQAQVHFVPMQSGWSFSDRVSNSGADSSRSFEAAGSYQVQAWVEYQVSYRLVGETDWQEVAGALRVESNTLEVLVGALYLKGDQKSQGALLVGADCTSKSIAFGC
jgi:hypothetical protein